MSVLTFKATVLPPNKLHMPKLTNLFRTDYGLSVPYRGKQPITVCKRYCYSNHPIDIKRVAETLLSSKEATFSCTFFTDWFCLQFLVIVQQFEVPFLNTSVIQVPMKTT